MLEEIVISLLVISLSCLGLIVYCHWRKLQKQEKEIEEISNIMVMVVEELNAETRERSGILSTEEV